MSEQEKELEHYIRDIQEISIAIDSWDDIFSDFDPSPLEQRVLSEDFLIELRKRHRESRSGNFIVTIYAPLSLKDENTEHIVTKRLKQYFKYRYVAITREISKLRKKGTLFILVGIILLGILTLLTAYGVVNKILLELIGIIVVPLGWFGIWEGFSRVIEPSPKSVLDQELFNKLSKATLKFKYAVDAGPGAAAPPKNKNPRDEADMSGRSSAL